MYGTPGSTESDWPSVRSAPLLRTKSLAFEQLLGLGISSLPMKPAAELPGSSCRRTSLGGACDVAPSSVTVTVGANAGPSCRTLNMTRDASDAEASRVELVSVRVAASITDCDEAAVPERLALVVLPLKLVLEADFVVIVDKLETRKPLLMPPAGEVVPAAGSAVGVPIEKPPVTVWLPPDWTDPSPICREETPSGSFVSTGIGKRLVPVTNREDVALEIIDPSSCAIGDPAGDIGITEDTDVVFSPSEIRANEDNFVASDVALSLDNDKAGPSGASAVLLREPGGGAGGGTGSGG